MDGGLLQERGLQLGAHIRRTCLMPPTCGAGAAEPRAAGLHRRGKGKASVLLTISPGDGLNVAQFRLKMLVYAQLEPTPGLEESEACDGFARRRPTHYKLTEIQPRYFEALASVLGDPEAWLAMKKLAASASSPKGARAPTFPSS